MDKLRYVSIRTLEAIKENNYESVYTKGYIYDRYQVDAEIERKHENNRRKAEKYAHYLDKQPTN